ncbi:MAG: PucR family transcriptional regulator [Halopseudomonas sp.]|uniref:PucR family transcriptional regulator n=1 Tax=Halopseudomonas sp. TaxID=2901191 RepID=UPI0030010AA6
MPLRCEDIPQLPGLAAMQLRAGLAGAQRQVRWPYVAENRSFGPWVKGGELVFITGISRHHSQNSLTERLYEAVASEVSGLVILTGDAYIGQVPNALLRLADQLQMPLLEQPYSLPMVQVTETIGRAIVRCEQAQARQHELCAGSLSERLQQRLGSPSEVADFLQPFIRCPVTEVLPLLDSLGAWLAHQGNLSAAAKAQGCHRNSLRYRLDKLFRLTGLDPHKATDQHTLILLNTLLAEVPGASASLEITE